MCIRDRMETTVEGDITMTFLQYRVLNNLGYDTELQQKALYDRDVVSDIFLDNLKTSTPWIIKAVNIKLLVDQIDHGKYEHIPVSYTHLDVYKRQSRSGGGRTGRGSQNYL